MLEEWTVFFSMSGSVEGGPEDKEGKYFRKGMRILGAVVGGASNRSGRRSLSLSSQEGR